MQQITRPASLELRLKACDTMLRLDVMEMQLDNERLVIEEKQEIAFEAGDKLKALFAQYGGEHPAVMQAYRIAQALQTEVTALIAHWDNSIKQYEELFSELKTYAELAKIIDKSQA